MNYLILGILLLTRIAFAECTILNIVPGKNYEFNCEGKVVSEKCISIKGLCEFKLNEKLKQYNAMLNKDKIENINSYSRADAAEITCTKEAESLFCQKKNNCSEESTSQSDRIFNYIVKKGFLSTKDDHCAALVSPISSDYLNGLEQLSCQQSLEGFGIENLENRITTQCPKIEIKSLENVNCKINGLIKLLNVKDSESNILEILQGKTCNGAAEIENDLMAYQLNKELRTHLINYLKSDFDDCKIMEINKKNIEQLICFKVEEFKFEKKIINNRNCDKNFRREISLTTSTAADREKNVDTRNIAGQPEKVDFTLPTEVPAIRNQETLQKIDKLIADNGGEVTPEIAKQAGAIFNSGIYQPTKNFINSVEKAISDRAGSSSSSGSSSPRYRGNKNDKAYEIGSKTSGARTVANITEEAPSAARATAINGKISAAPGSSASAENDVVNSQSNNKEFTTSNKQNDKLSSNNFSAGSSSAGGPQGSVSVGGSAPNLASASSGARGEELPQLPSLSAADKSEITKVVQALKGAESSEDVKSIVTGEDNFAQVKRIIQELEQNKKNTVQNREINNARNPASVQSGEVKDFEKTLEKFGIKVYGEAGPGKAVYAPQTVNHVIVLKNNTVQFLNTIRSKK